MKNSDENEDRAPLDAPRFWKVQPGSAIGIFQLGTPRDELLQMLEKEDIEFEDDETEPTEVNLFDMETVLYFSEVAPYPLVLIEVDDDRIRFGTLKVFGDFPHNILGMMQIPETETLWCEDLSQITNPEATPASPEKRSDVELLQRGTLWITSLGIGLGLIQGSIITLYLCDPANSPRVGNGGFTSDQRHRSERMQLASFKAEASKVHPLRRIVHGLLIITALAVVAFFGKQAWDEQQKWNNAPEVEGEVIEALPPPPDPFPNKFTIRYADAAGKLHQVEWGRNDTYALFKVGDKTSLRYLPESPDIAMGPAKLNDVGFNLFFPYLLGTFGAYLVLHFVSDFVLSREIWFGRKPESL